MIYSSFHLFYFLSFFLLRSDEFPTPAQPHQDYQTSPDINKYSLQLTLKHLYTPTDASSFSPLLLSSPPPAHTIHIIKHRSRASRTCLTTASISKQHSVLEKQTSPLLTPLILHQLIGCSTAPRLLRKQLQASTSTMHCRAHFDRKPVASYSQHV